MTLQVASPDVGTSHEDRATIQGQSGWLVVAEQESRDLWTSGRGLILLFLFSILLSALTYLTSTNQALNFLEQRESVNLVLQLAVAVGVLVTLVVSADAISGERERGTLESLLVTPVSRRSFIAGKLIAALTMWFATFVVTIPYVWVLARGVGILGQALALAYADLPDLQATDRFKDLLGQLEIALVARSGPDPEADRNRTHVREPLGDHALAGIELAEHVLLHPLIVLGGQSLK